MYEDYYGFVEKPFSLTPDPKYLYKSESHGSAFELLQYSIRRREGFVVITGDIGTGKTTLCRALLEQIDRNTFSALVLNPFLSEEDLLKLILQDFGVVSREDVKSGRLAGVSKQELIDTLYDFLLSLLPLRASAVLIIDEAQNLPLPVLEQIRILSNLETDKEKLLQIVLVGQLNLNGLLRAPEMRQLDQRVSIRYELQPLTRDEVASYVSHRLSIAGGSAVSFAPKALQVVHRLSNGIPRLINLICDRTLLAAYSNRTSRILPDTVRKAAESLDIRPMSRWRKLGWLKRRPSIVTAVLAAVGLAAAIGGGFLTMTGVLASSDDSMMAASVDQRPEPPDAPPLALAPIVRSGVVTDGEPQRPYTVVVGSYPMNDVARAQSLPRLASVTSRLTAMGYDVYHVDVDLGARGPWRRVLAGEFDAMEEAARDEARLRVMREFDDARAVRSSTVRAAATTTP
jgi:type II secretory pathway predicted ATPase ExeA